MNYKKWGIKAMISGSRGANVMNAGLGGNKAPIFG